MSQPKTEDEHVAQLQTELRKGEPSLGVIIGCVHAIPVERLLREFPSGERLTQGFMWYLPFMFRQRGLPPHVPWYALQPKLAALNAERLSDTPRYWRDGQVRVKKKPEGDSEAASGGTRS